MRSVQTLIGIQVEPKLFIDAFIENTMLKDWWDVERALIVPRPGGVYSLAWNVSAQGFGYVSSGTIDQYEPSKLLQIQNMVYFNPSRPLLGPMSLTISARSAGEYSECHVIQSGYQDGEHWDWYYEAVKDAWPQVMQKLKHYLETYSNLN